MYLRISFKSQMLGRGVGVHAFLPFHDGYEDAQAPYPTLYFLPGYSANAEELATLLPLRRFSAEYGVAVIIPDGENSFYTDHPERCARERKPLPLAGRLSAGGQKCPARISGHGEGNRL